MGERGEKPEGCGVNNGGLFVGPRVGGALDPGRRLRAGQGKLRDPGLGLRGAWGRPRGFQEGASTVARGGDDEDAYQAMGRQLWETVRPDILSSELTPEGTPRAYRQFDPGPVPVMHYERVRGVGNFPVGDYYDPRYSARGDYVQLAQGGEEDVRPWWERSELGRMFFDQPGLSRTMAARVAAATEPSPIQYQAPWPADASWKRKVA